MSNNKDNDFVNSLLPPPPLVEESDSGSGESGSDSSPNKNNDTLLPPPLPDDDENQEMSGPETLAVAYDTIPSEDQGATRPLATKENKTAPELMKQAFQLEGYQIHRKVGQGGMGVVYLAGDLNLGRDVAIKVLNAAAPSKIRDRFLVEAQTVAGLQHPNIAALHSTNEFQGQPCLIMEYVDGGSLQESIDYSPQPPIASAQTVKTLALAMQYCHEQGVIHRDLKPSNVLLDSSAALKIADFGLAKSLFSDSSATRTGEILGTPGYMAPEQASGVVKTLGPACDVYGLGGILYTLLTGRVPFDSPDPMRTVMMVLSNSPVSPKKLQPDVPQDLETICLKCLEKSPRARYASAAELAEDLDCFINHRPIKARPVSRIEKAIKWARRHPASAALILILLAAIPAIFGAQWFHSSQLAKELDRSQRLANQGSDFSEWVIRDHVNQLRNFNGTTALQRDVATRSQEYLDLTTPDAPQTSKFLLRHADSYRLLALILGSSTNQNLGESKQALKNYQSSIELFEKTMKIAPDDKKLHRMMAVCYANMSELAGMLNGSESRKKYLQKAVATLEGSNHKQGAQYWLSHVIVHDAVANQCIQDHEFEKALAELELIESSIPELKGDVAKTVPELKMTLARKRAQVHESLGEYEQAVAKARKAVRLIRGSIENGENPLILTQQLSTNLILLADNQCQISDFEGALESYQKALAIRESRYRQDTGNVSATDDLSLALARTASAWLYLEKSDRALPLAKRAVELRRKLAAADAENRLHQRVLMIDIGTVASIYTELGRTDEAVALHQERLAILRKLVKQKNPERSNFVLLGEVHFYLALNHLTRLLEEDDIEDIEMRDRKLYAKMTDNFSASIAAFNRARKMGSLSQVEQSFLESVRQAQDFAESSIDQMENADSFIL